MSPLDGKRVLVVEDEALIAAMVEDMLVELGATVVGPASSIDQARVLVHSDDIDAAVLDVNIRSERVDPIAEILRLRSVPIVFATGYGSSTCGMNYSPAIEKPYTLEKLANALKTALLTAASR
jgi:two-component SAPR family response regulator